VARRVLRVLGHPVHAMSVHYPMALLSVAVLWDALGLARQEARWADFAFWSIAAGLASAVPAAVAGFVDYVRLEGDDSAGRAGLYHMAFMLCAAGFFGFSLLVRMRVFPGTGDGAAIACDIGGFALLALGGWFGGELVFGHGVGVRDAMRR
jgi:uncharacterized membrane protein